MAKMKLEGKLTSGFPAMTTTVQVHKRSPRDGFLQWIVEAITVAALNYGMREALDSVQRLDPEAVAAFPGERWCNAGKLHGLYPGHHQINLGQEAMRLR